jgi:peptidoglycan/LPS O-acetylase OafA/YrhL
MQLSNSSGGTLASVSNGRRNNFDTFRLVAASSVLFSHAFLIGAGHEKDEPFKQLSGNILGLYGVAIFFIISGYLITKSWFDTPNSLTFVIKRVLRIYPGLTACVLLSALVLAPFFHVGELSTYFTSIKYYDHIVENLFLRYYDAFVIPDVFFYGPKIDYSLGSVINGSLWTIRWEVSCYLLILLLGQLRVLNLWTSFAILILSTIGFYLRLDGTFWPFVSFVVLPAFAAGMTLFFIHRDARLPAGGAFLCLLGLAILSWFGQTFIAFSILGAYIIIYLAVSPSVYMGNAARYGDLSYGVYLYGWPIEQCARYALGDGASWWAILALALPISFACGWLSWRLIEHPMLRLKGIFKEKSCAAHHLLPRLYSSIYSLGAMLRRAREPEELPRAQRG